MLKLTDIGCHRHHRRQVTFRGMEAEIMKDVIASLPREGDYHTFICEHGHTHRLSFIVSMENFYPKFALSS